MYGSPSKQQGIALVLSLLLLMVMTILGISAMNNSIMQQRMAGNAYLQAQAFEAAATGVANAIEFAFEEGGSGAVKGGKACNSSTDEEWFGDWVDMGQVGEAWLRQRMYCLPYSGNGEKGAELFVLSRGEIRAGDKAVAKREIEVRVDRIGFQDGPLCNSVAMCFPIDFDPHVPFDQCPPPSSGAFCGCAWPKDKGKETNPFSAASGDFEVMGAILDEGVGYGTAIALGPTALLALQCAITGGDTQDSCVGKNTGGCNRLGQYKGGFESATEFGEPWDDPADTYAFAESLLQIAHAQIDGQFMDSSSTHWRDNFNVPRISDKYTGIDFNGDLGNGLTYIAGDASFGGNVTGSGILVVEGRLAWNGTPNFDGLIIVLGGEFNVAGGGKGGNHSGSIVVVDLDTKPSEHFDSATGTSTPHLHRPNSAITSPLTLAVAGAPNSRSTATNSGRCTSS